MVEETQGGWKLVCWSQLILTQVDISSQICLQGCHIGSLTWAMVGVFTSDKSEYATNKRFLFSCEELSVKLFTSILMIGNTAIEERMGAGRSLTLSPPPTLPQGILSLYSYRANEILLQFKELSSGIQTGVGSGKLCLYTQANSFFFFLNNISLWWLPEARMQAIQLRGKGGQIIYC